MNHLSFKEDITLGKILIGTWVQIGSPEVVEMVGLSGFDFAVIDTEHTSFSVETSENLIRAADAVGLTSFIRVSRKDPSLIMKALDSGAHGIVYPGVSCKKDAKEAVSAANFPPNGNRGSCPFVRAAGHLAEDWPVFAKNSNDQIVTILLVEGKEGVENFSEIISVPGVDAVMLGPFDLSVVLGVGGQVEHPKVMEAFEKMATLAASKEVILIPNIFNNNLDDVERLTDIWLNKGCKTIIINTDKLIFSWGLKQNLNSARQSIKSYQQKAKTSKP